MEKIDNLVMVSVVVNIVLSVIEGNFMGIGGWLCTFLAWLYIYILKHPRNINDKTGTD